VRAVCPPGANALPQFKTASLVHLAHLDQLVKTANPEIPDPRDNLDHPAHQPILAPNPTVRVSLAHPDQLDQPVPTDKPDQWDLPANPAPMDNPDPEAHPAQLDHPEMLDQPEALETMANPAHPARMAKMFTTPPARRDPMDLPDLEARTAVPDNPVPLESPDQWDHPARPAIPDIPDKTEAPVNPVDLEFPARTPITAHALTVPPSSSRRQPSTLKLFNIEHRSNGLVSSLDLNRTTFFCNFSNVVFAMMLSRMVLWNLNRSEVKLS